MILDNHLARSHKGRAVRRWARDNRVELCFDRADLDSSWANPIEAHFGPHARSSCLNNSQHPNHIVLTRRLHAYLRWRNANARDPDLLDRATVANAPEPEPRKATAGARPLPQAA